MTTAAQVIQGVREWLKTAATLTDDQVFPADAVGGREIPPFLTVKITASDIGVGEDEDVAALDGDGNPTLTARGCRLASVSVQAFGGTTALGWLAAARLSLRLPAMQAQLNGDGIVIVPVGAPRDLSRLVDTAIESRAVWDLQVRYGVTSAAEEQVAAETVQLTTTFENDADPLTAVTTIDLTP